MKKVFFIKLHFASAAGHAAKELLDEEKGIDFDDWHLKEEEEVKGC